jgi:Chromo shadow domain
MEVDLPDTVLTDLPQEEAVVPPIFVKPEPVDDTLQSANIKTEIDEAETGKGKKKPIKKSSKPTEKVNSKAKKPAPTRTSVPDSKPLGRSPENAVIGLVPEKILNATRLNEELVYHITCKDSEKQCYVTAASARKCYPQLVIDFFEERIEWTD